MIIILNLINLFFSYIPPSINNLPSNELRLELNVDTREFLNRSLNRFLCQIHFSQFTGIVAALNSPDSFPTDAACSTSSYPFSRRTRKAGSAVQASQPDEIHIQYALITSSGAEIQDSFPPFFSVLSSRVTEDGCIFADRADIGRIKMQPSSVPHSSSRSLKHSPSWILKLQNNRDVEMNRLR